jgi:hypothetical protein
MHDFFLSSHVDIHAQQKHLQISHVFIEFFNYSMMKILLNMINVMLVIFIDVPSVPIRHTVPVYRLDSIDRSERAMNESIVAISDMHGRKLLMIC